MTTYTPTLQKSFQATAAAIAVGVRVKIDSNGLISAAAAAEAAIGTTIEAIAASGYGTVLLFGPSRLMTASAAISRASALYPAAAGRVASSGTTLLTLMAGEAATAAGDIIECFETRLGA